VKINVIAVGQKMPAWVQDGYNEYARRMPREIQPALVELPLANRSKATSTAAVKDAEGQQIIATCDQLPGKTMRIALDVQGKPLTTERLAKKLQSWQMEGVNPCLIIGGPDGLSPQVLQQAHEKWSLSGLTLPHPLVRVVLMEQLYRAWTILQNHPYHK